MAVHPAADRDRGGAGDELRERERAGDLRLGPAELDERAQQGRAELIGAFTGGSLPTLRSRWETGPADEKPAIWIDANIHAAEVTTSSAALATIRFQSDAGAAAIKRTARAETRTRPIACISRF